MGPRQPDLQSLDQEQVLCLVGEIQLHRCISDGRWNRDSWHHHFLCDQLSWIQLPGLVG